MNSPEPWFKVGDLVQHSIWLDLYLVLKVEPRVRNRGRGGFECHVLTVLSQNTGAVYREQELTFQKPDELQLEKKLHLESFFLAKG